MNMKDAKKLKAGAIVREAFFPDSTVQGIVLSKVYVKEVHTAKQLGQIKKERFNITVHWLGPANLIPRMNWNDRSPSRVQVRENWELMVISHVDS